MPEETVETSTPEETVETPTPEKAKEKKPPKKVSYGKVVDECRRLGSLFSSTAEARRYSDGNIAKISRVEGAKLVLQFLDGGKKLTPDNVREILGV